MQSAGCQRLLHLTDTHLFADPATEHGGVNVEQRFQAVRVALCAQAPQADGLLHTGDIVHDHSAVAYARVRQQLTALNLPGRVTFGNHDDIALMQRYFAEGLVNTQRVLALGEWALVMLNSQVSGSVHGALPAKELAALDEALATCRAPFVILALHHPPVPVGSAWLDEIGLQAPEALLARIAADPRIRALVFGHVHQPFDASVGHCRMLATPATAAQFTQGAVSFMRESSAPAYRIIDLCVDGRVDSKVVTVPTKTT